MKTARDVMAIRAGDEVKPTDVVWVEKRQEGKVVGRASSARFPLSSGRAEIREDGSIHIMVSGPVRQSERGTADVARILVDRLKRSGARWGEVHCRDRDERGVDCEAWDEQGNHLQMQVTRADHDIAFYRRQAADDRAEKVYANLDVLTDAWRERIRVKATRLAGRGDITLALDAAEASPTLPDAIEVFRARHGAWAREQGFKDIWIVGASWDWTCRLDVG